MGNSQMQNQPKHPPHSVEAEMSVLGGMMLNNRAIDEVMDHLSANDFYQHAHQIIFSGIVALHDARHPCDFVTVTEYLRAKNKLDDAGGLSYLGGLVNDTPSAANIRAYAEIVRERAMLRSLIAAGLNIAESGYRPNGEAVGALVDKAESAVFSIREQTAAKRTTLATVSTLVAEIESDIEDAAKTGELITGLFTGFADLDRLTTGLHPGDLVIVAGRPSMGKTSFAINIAENVSPSVRTLVFSMEMPAKQLAMRLMSSASNIDLQHLRTGHLNESDYERLTRAAGPLRESSILIDDAPGLTPLDLRSRARRVAANGGLGLIIVDYIQLMSSPGKENRTNEVDDISRNLKSLAKELHIPVIALSQLNRGVESRPDKRPRSSDLRESGSIEQDADLIMLVYRDEKYDPNSADAGTAEIIISKQRNGDTGMVRLAFDGKYARFSNLAHGWKSKPQEAAKSAAKPRGFGAVKHWQETESAGGF